MTTDLIRIDPVLVLGQYLEPELNARSPYAVGVGDRPEALPVRPGRDDHYWKYPVWWQPDDRNADYVYPTEQEPRFMLFASGGLFTGQFEPRTTVQHRVDCYLYGGTDRQRRTLDSRIVMLLDREGSWRVPEYGKNRRWIRLPKILTRGLSYDDTEALVDGEPALDDSTNARYTATVFSVTKIGLEMDVRPFSRITHTDLPVSMSIEPNSRVLLRSFSVDFGKYYSRVS